jgi:hypothetical protein
MSTLAKRIAQNWLTKQAGSVDGAIQVLRDGNPPSAQVLLWVTFRDTKVIPIDQFPKWAKVLDAAAQKFDQNLKKQGASVSLQGPPMLVTDQNRIRCTLYIQGPGWKHTTQDLDKAIKTAMKASGISVKRK